MIVSHSGKFCFVKTRKTAGTSIEVALARHLKPGDWASPLEEHDPSMRAITRSFVRAIRNRSNTVPARSPHLPATVIADLFPEETRGYFSFCVERNPWDKAVSAFFFLASKNRVPRGRTVTDRFLRFATGPRLATFSDFDLYMRDGAPQVTEILQYDELADGLARLSEERGIPRIDLSGTRMKSTQRPASARDLTVFFGESLNNDADACVRQAFAREIAYFGYQPPDISAAA